VNWRISSRGVSLSFFGKTLENAAKSSLPIFYRPLD